MCVETTYLKNNYIVIRALQAALDKAQSEASEAASPIYRDLQLLYVTDYAKLLVQLGA